MTDDQTPYWDEMTLAEREACIRRPLALIRKAWPLEPSAPSGGGGHSAPGSRIPTNVDALTTSAAITHDLAYWCRALLEDHPEGFGEQQSLSMHDVPAMIEHLIREARWASGWSQGWEMQSYLAELAHDASLIAWPRARGEIPLGECPVTVGVDGEVVVCSTTVRATAENPGEVKCRGCGTTDTIDGWILRIVGDEPLVTAEQLVPILHKRLGVIVKPGAIRMWKNRGEITSAGVDDKGRDLFDRQHAFVVVTRREARRSGRAS